MQHLAVVLGYTSATVGCYVLDCCLTTMATQLVSIVSGIMGVMGFIQIHARPDCEYKANDEGKGEEERRKERSRNQAAACTAVPRLLPMLAMPRQLPMLAMPLLAAAGRVDVRQLRELTVTWIVISYKLPPVFGCEYALCTHHYVLLFVCAHFVSW